MAGGHLSNEEFFTRLTQLFDANKSTGHGSIYLTQKRLTHSLDADDGTKNAEFPPSAATVADDPFWDLHPPQPVPVLIRATDGKSKSKVDRARGPKVKLSTVVMPSGLEGFYTRYAEVCRNGMGGLKKRDRRKRKQEKRKKKAGVEGEKKG